MQSIAEPKTAGDLVQSLESLLTTLKELPPETVIRQYVVSNDGSAAQVVSKFTFASLVASENENSETNETRDPYLKVETYCEEDLLEVDDDIEMVFLKDSDLQSLLEKK